MGSSLNPAGIKKPSPGFILKADASLAPLNNAQIEVRAMSGARAPSRFPHPRAVRAACQSGGSPAGFDGFRGRFGIFFERDVGRVHPKTRGGSRSVEKHRLVSIRVFSSRLRCFCMFRAPSAERRALTRLTRTLLLRRASLAPRDFFTSTNHRTASCIGPTTGCGTKPRWCL